MAPYPQMSAKASAPSEPLQSAPDGVVDSGRLNCWRKLRRPHESLHFRYAAVGGFNTAFGYGAFVALRAAFGGTTHYLIALVAAHIISVLVAFVGYRMIVFRVRGQVFKDLARFWSVYALVLGFNIVALPLLVELAGLHVFLAQGIFALVTAVVSYLAHGHFSFKRQVLNRG